MRREERLAFARDAERGLELGPGGERSAAPPRRGGPARSARSLAIAEAGKRRERRSPRSGGGSAGRARGRRRRCPPSRSSRLVVLERDRLVGAVPARQHERPLRSPRRAGGGAACREQHAEPREPGATDSATRRVRPAPDQHDRPRARARAARPPRRSTCASAPGRRSSARTASPRAACARAAARRRARRRVAGEVVAAEALDREDRCRRGAGRSPSSSGIESRGPQAGQAIGSAWKRRSAGSSYSRRQSAHIVKPAIVVFGRSYGNALDDREARAALRAVDERVAVAAVGRVEELAQAVVAGGDVGRDRARCGLSPALSAIVKVGSPRLGTPVRCHCVDTRQRRGLALERQAEGVEGARVALRLDRRHPSPSFSTKPPSP